MAKKKPNDQKDTVKPASQIDTGTPASDVFKSIFGHVSTTTTTLFSDDNPFKRKPQDSSQLKEEPEKEKKKEKSLSFDENEKNQLGFEKIGGIEEVGIENDDKKRRKKRKRDDLEREYEVKKYGAAAVEVKERERNVRVGEKRKKKDDEVAELVVEKEEEEGFDDESKLLRTVFVGNLPMKVKKKELFKEFSKFGDVQSVRIRSVPITDTKIPRKGAIIRKKINDTVDSVHAYIVFKTEQSAEASLAHNMAVVGGNHIRVDRACPPRKKLKGEDSPLYDAKRTIFVGNLPFDVKDEEIYQLFCSFKDLESSIEAVRVIRHPHVGLGKGIAYVLLKTKEAVNLALKKRNVKLRDRELRLSRAQQDSTPLKKRRNSFPSGMATSPAKKRALDSSAERSSGANTKATMSYQGLRANKAGKIHPKRTVAMKVKSNSQKGEKGRVLEGQVRKGRIRKRPAVEARKAKANAVKDGGAPNLAGRKRKMDGQTPDSFKQKKKSKKLR